MTEKHSKTKTSFYRRIYIAYLIDSEANTVPSIIATTGMPRRTAQDTIIALADLGIDVEYTGGTKNGYYKINNWGAISKNWIKTNLTHIKAILNYP